MESIPWWGWVIIAVVGFVILYYAVAAVFFAKVSKRVFRSFDDVTERKPFGGRDPFDDPFFKDPFGKGTTRKPHDKYL